MVIGSPVDLDPKSSLDPDDIAKYDDQPEKLNAAGKQTPSDSTINVVLNNQDSIIENNYDTINTSPDNPIDSTSIAAVHGVQQVPSQRNYELLIAEKPKIEKCKKKARGDKKAVCANVGIDCMYCTLKINHPSIGLQRLKTDAIQDAIV